MKASMTRRNILISLASIGMFLVTIAPPPPALASGMIPDDLREIWTDYLIDNWAKTDANLPLFNPARVDSVISRRPVCGNAPQADPTDPTETPSEHVCKDPTGATDDLVMYFDVEFHTLYWEYELEQLEAACKASGVATSDACRTQHQIVMNFNVNSITADFDDPGADPDVMMQRSAQAHQAWECEKCDEVLDPDAPNKPVAVIEAFGALVVPAAAVGTGSANLPVLVAVGFGDFARKLEEAATFALRNDAAVLLVNAPGETGNTGEYEPSSLFVADTVSWAKTMDLADRVRIACDPDFLPDGSRPPQPCVGFRDLTNWNWRGTDWSSVWSELNLALFQEADGAIAANPMPNLGPIEFQSSEFHDLVDTDPDPRDSWFFRAAFAVMRGITFVEKMDAPTGAPGVPYGDPNAQPQSFDRGLVDSTKIALGGTSRGGIVAYMVNGLDDRVDAMIVSGTGGLFPASYDDNAMNVSASTSNAYGNPQAPGEGMCVYPETAPAPENFVNPFRPTGDAFKASEVGEIDERYWNVDCAVTPTDAKCSTYAEKLYDPSWNDDSSLKHAQLAYLWCDEDFDAGLSSLNTILPPGAPRDHDLAQVGGSTGLAANPAQIDRADCEPPSMVALGKKQRSEYDAFLKYFDPFAYTNNDPGCSDLSEPDPETGTCGTGQPVPGIYQHGAILHVQGAQDQVFPINTATETFRRARDIQAYAQWIERGMPAGEMVSRSVLQLIGNLDHPFFYSLPTDIDDASKSDQAFLMSAGSTRKDLGPPFSQTVVFGPAFHPLADYYARYAGFGSDRLATFGGTGDPKIFPRVNNQSTIPKAMFYFDPPANTMPFGLSQAARTVDLFFKANVVDETLTVGEEWPLPAFADYRDNGTDPNLVEIEATFDPALLSAGEILPAGAACVDYELRVAVSFDRGFKYNAHSVKPNPYRSTGGNHPDGNFGTTCVEVLRNSLCKRATCSDTNPTNAQLHACVDETNFCREPHRMFFDSADVNGVETWTTAVAGDDTANPERWPHRIVKPGAAEWNFPDVAAYDVDYTVGFIEVFGTYTDGVCAGGCGSCTDEKDLIPFYFTGLPAVPSGSSRSLDYQVYMRSGFGLDTTTGKWWFRPRVRSVGGIGAGSGDTCCTWPGEIVKIQPDPQDPAELVAMPGDFIGDACNAEHLVGGVDDLAKLLRLRYSAWVGTTFSGDLGLLDEIILWRRAPQFADNDRDGVGNPCEDMDYASHGAWAHGDPQPPGTWDREIVNSGGSGGDFITPDRHGVPQPIPGAGTGGGGCSVAKADGSRALGGAGAYLAVALAVAAAARRRRSAASGGCNVPLTPK